MFIKHRYCVLGLAILSLVFGSVASIAEDSSVSDARLNKIDGLLTNARELALQRNEMCGVLIAQLRDVNLSAPARIRCAEALASLNCNEAIAVLIEFIELTDPSAVRPERSIENVYPCIPILAQYGDAAMPQLVKAWVATGDSRKRTMILMSLRHSTICSNAVAFAKGMAIHSVDKGTTASLNELADAIEAK
ncbi:MAG: hypothetical protein KF688_14945 [Pirellulales bacterium]|nr:hypothetical protein [Nitrospira sp.]MBX3426973.1 hypothetical protein [Pirellulales bacterium]